jgi:hypothetical protein
LRRFVESLLSKEAERIKKRARGTRAWSFSCHHPLREGRASKKRSHSLLDSSAN